MKIIDLHCDTISKLYQNGGSLYMNNLQFDLQRACRSQVEVQFMALFTRPADSNTCLRQILKQIVKFQLEMDRNYSCAYLLLNSAQLDEPQNLDKVACILHCEGAECLDVDDELLNLLYKLGLRSMGLTWNNRNLLADGAGEGLQAGGLSRKGREVIKRMEMLSIMLDLAHISSRSFYEALECYSRPVLVTHANAQALCPHWRNLDDSQLRTLADHGGVVGVTQVSDFVKEGNARRKDFLAHIDYIASLIGVEHVALGSDFDGADNMVINDVDGYADLETDLAQQGFTAIEIEMILNGNARSIIKSVI